MQTASWPTQWFEKVVPLAVLLAISATDMALGRDRIVFALIAVVPLLAANLASPRVTGTYAVLSFGVGAAIGEYHQQYDDASWVAQMVRLTGIGLSGAAAVFISRYRLLRERRLVAVTRVAEAAQRAILIPVPDSIGPITLAVGYESAASESLIGGDLYGVVAGPFGVRVLVADVRGKGLDAVRLSAQVLAAFRERALDNPSLGQLLDHLDRSVERAAEFEDFVTAALLQIDTCGTMTLALAGHPFPLLVRGRWRTTLIPTQTRPPLGLGGDTTTFQMQLIAGDRVLLYTDGLTEARQPGTRAFPPEEMITNAIAHGTVPEAIARLRADLVDWSGGSLADDVALVLIEYTPGQNDVA